MATRSFGPTQGAGTRIEEQSNGNPIVPGALGWVAYAGVLDRGPIGELIILTSRDDKTLKIGGRIAASTLPDVIEHYFEIAAGAGGVLAVRVTDGNELAASIPLYNRNAAARTQLGTLSAQNGGTWGGRRRTFWGNFTAGGDLTTITLDTGLATFTTDEWAGGTLYLDAVTNQSWEIVGNTAAGIITVVADADILAAWTAAAAPTNFGYYLERANVDERGNERALSVEIRDGAENPTSEFGVYVYLDGDLVKAWPNLSVDTNSARYWAPLINNDGGNFYVTAADTFTGTRDATARPANQVGEIGTVTATVLTPVLSEFTVVTSPTGANPTHTLGTTTDLMVAQVLTITMTSASAFDVVSDVFGALGSGTEATLFTPANNRAPPFTITNGATILATGNVLRLVYKGLRAGDLVDGLLFPDIVNFPTTSFRIVANTHSAITVAAGSDMTAVAAIADQWRAQYRDQLAGGRDGIADLVDADFVNQAFTVGSSPFDQLPLLGGYGLVKFASPGQTATAVQQAGRAYAAARNHQFRYEVPAATVTADAAATYLDNTLGRSDYAKVSFPSFGYIVDPDGEGAEKLVPLTGKIHGREARIAADYETYAKAEAGIDATLPGITRLATGDTVLNEEFLNPRGINVIRKRRGNFILWGDRMLAVNSEWRFAHAREVMSYWEQTLSENLDWVIFGFNDPQTRAQVVGALKEFFLGAYRRRALDNNLAFEDAAIIQSDLANNPAAVRAAGDAVVDVKVKITDVVERLKIRMSKQGVFDSAA
jgi:hypothetical protein